jgi:hypothetical protein
LSEIEIYFLGLFDEIIQKKRRREIIHKYIAKINQIDKTLLSKIEKNK